MDNLFDGGCLQIPRRNCWPTSKASPWMRAWASWEPCHIAWQRKWNSGTRCPKNPHWPSRGKLPKVKVKSFTYLLTGDLHSSMSLKAAERSHILLFARRRWVQTVSFPISLFALPESFSFLPSDLASLSLQMPPHPQSPPTVALAHEKTERTFWNRSALILPVSKDSAIL